MAFTGREHSIPVEKLLRVAFWSILLAAITYTTTDPDLWGHIRFGLDILRDASLPRIDPYSFTSDRMWVNHEWAAEVIMAGAFRIGGNSALIVIKLIVVGATLFLLDSTLRREGVTAAVTRDAAAAVALLSTMEQTHHVRPQIFSILCFAVLLWCLAATGRGIRRWLIVLPPLFAIWANLHGGWIVGGAVLGLWTIGLLIGGARKQAAWCIAAGAVCLAATLITPYGFGLWQFLHDTVGFGRADIVEWQPIYALGWDNWVRWGATLVLAMVGVALTRRADILPERIGIVAGLAAASFMVTRLLAFFALAVLFLLGGALGRAYQRRRAAGAAVERPVVRRGVAVVALLVTAASAFLIAGNVTRVRIDSRFTPEPGAVAILNRQPHDGRLLVWFDWGEYAIWHLSPGMRVSIDGRRETVYSVGLHDRHLRFYFDAPGGAALPRELAADYIWIPRTLPAARRLEADGAWRRLYEGDQSVIFGRVGLTLPSAGVEPTAATARVFPGP